MPRFIVISTDWDEQTHFVDYVSANNKQAAAAIAAEARPDTQVSVAFTSLDLSLYLHDMLRAANDLFPTSTKALCRLIGQGRK
jgi:hypothetical protein